LSRCARNRILSVVLVVLFATLTTFAESGSTVVSPAGTSPNNILIGFVGGFVRHDNPRHGPVRLAQRMHETAPKDSYVQVFENRHRRAAYNTIVRLLDTDHNGALSESEKSRARVILFGHSWGGSAVVLLARELRRAGIPVLLTVQVDSVTKPWQSDSVIPDNVVEAVNFHQPHGMIHGRAQITAADPSKTQILGNYLYDYRKHPVQCQDPSFFDRVFTPDHAQSECDPKLWSQIEDLVRQRLATALNTATITSQP
jgi:pimeloyl-ACP methyl ester carboxylesterase